MQVTYTEDNDMTQKWKRIEAPAQATRVSDSQCAPKPTDGLKHISAYHATASGVYRVDGAVRGDGYLVCGSYSNRKEYRKGRWFISLDDAVACAEMLRARKIEELQAKIAAISEIDMGDVM